MQLKVALCYHLLVYCEIVYTVFLQLPLFEFQEIPFISTVLYHFGEESLWTLFNVSVIPLYVILYVTSEGTFDLLHVN